MAETSDLAKTLAAEVARQIPLKDAYDDAVKPAARQVGNLAEDLAKTILLVLAPLQVAAAYQDRFRDFLDKSIRRVPEQDRLPPPPQILGPVLEGIRYEPEDSPITEMFSQLLSASMNEKQVQNAHPAFTHIVKQLSADEANLLNAMWQLWKGEGRSFRQQFTQEYDAKRNRFDGMKMEIDELPRSGLMFPEALEFYGQHLYALGITAFFDGADQKPLFHMDRLTGERVQTGIRVFKELRFTDVGLRFMAAVSVR